MLDAVEDQRAVRQAGERVVQRLVAHARLAFLAVQGGREQVGHRGKPLAVRGGERADGGGVHGDVPKAPARPRIAAPAVLRRPRPRSAAPSKRRSLAHSQTTTGSSPEMTQPVSRRSGFGECPGSEPSGRWPRPAGGEADAVAARDELEDRAVLDAEGLGDERDGLVEERLAVGDAERHAAQAAHRGLAAGALGLGGGAAGLELGALGLAAGALGVGAAELAREAVDHHADDDERHHRDHPVVDVDGKELVGIDVVVGADEQSGGEGALGDRVAQAEEERVGRRPEKEVGKAARGLAARHAERGGKDRGQRAGPSARHRRLVGDAPDEQDAERLRQPGDRQHRHEVVRTRGLEDGPPPGRAAAAHT